jgi:DNA invertase Pin-like site-specific DNA recombinase
MAPKKFIAYLRVSSQKQGRSGLGIEAQRARVREFMAGAAPVSEFIERESGKRTDRVQLLAALAACRVHKATLIVAKLDRLARNQSFLMALIDSGVDVRFCDLPEIPAGAAGRFMLQQMAAVAELEAGLISERTRAALKAKIARDGQWDRKAKHHLQPGAGQAAAAAAVAARAKQAALDLAPVITKARESGATTLCAIAAALDREGIPAPRGGQWSAASVSRVLAKIADYSAVQ